MPHRGLSNVNEYDIEKIWERNHKEIPPVERCIHDLYAEQVKVRPDDPAICAWDGDTTYWELDKLSTRLASHLISLGITTEEMVPLCFDKSMWAVVAMLAVLKSGGAFVPLEPTHPITRHEEIFKQTKARVVLTSVQHKTLWPDSTRTVLAIDETFISQLSCENTITYSKSKPCNTIYVMFTSGSTGIPKGVVLEHRAVATSCLAHGRAIKIAPNTRALQFSAYTFDASIAEIITTLIHGGCVCIPSEDDRRNALSETMNTMKVNWAQLTPTVARLLDPQKIPSLEVLVLGGERVSSVDWERWGNRVEQINAYGPTECSVWCAFHHNGAQDFQSGMIGKPIASVGWVVDEDDHNRLVPIGSIGELLVEGPIIARGYFNDTLKTEKVFINNPTWLVEGSNGHAGRQGRLYKTGDLVYCCADGNMVYIGRKDGQVKIHGQRVELGEIEHHLHECMPEIENIAVEIISPIADETKSMVAAFLQLDKQAWQKTQEDKLHGDKSTASIIVPVQLEEELTQRLPAHMVPTVFFALANFPLTVSGKADRRRLKEIGASFTSQQLTVMRRCLHGPKRHPSTENEKALQQLWAGVLAIDADSIGLDDSFFRLGGDSIAAMKLVGEARRAGIHLT
ncbi:hypothetical protein PTT_18488, partial [Pyrenophora teres f. teres 0-1]